MQKSTEVEMEGVAALESMDVPVDDNDTSPSMVYEIGYHLLPSLSEEGVAGAVKELTALLEKNGGIAVGDHFPSKIPLAYTLTKRVGAQLLRFDEAYFGWVAFEMSRETIQKVKEALDANPSVLRYLIIKTSRDAVAATLTGAVAAVPVTGDIGKPKREAESGGEVSDVALDEVLQTMAAEDAKTPE